MKPLFLFILFLYVVASSAQTESDERTADFPKKEQKVINLPTPDNVWVFILAGQSNMAGRGLVESRDTIPSTRILTINKHGEFIVAKEPLHFYEPSLTGLDCGLSFGKELIRQIPDDISILLLPAAVGGSSVSQWLGDSLHRDVRLLSNLKEKIELGKKVGHIKAILWHQGESDTNAQDAHRYKERLTHLFSVFREFAGDEKLPILIGELGSYSNNKEYWRKINEQIKRYTSADSYSRVISTSDLKDKGDMLHFNSEGQRLMGQRFANEYIQMIK